MLSHPDYSQLKIKPSDLLRRPRHRPSSTTGEACGSCPACGVVVVLAPITEEVMRPCPSCGALVDHLVALGS